MKEYIIAIVLITLITIFTTSTFLVLGMLLDITAELITGIVHAIKRK